MSLARIDPAACEAGWLHSHYGAVFAVLRDSLDSPLAALVPGTGGMIDAALAHFRHSGDAAAMRRLETIALAAHELNLAMRAASAGDIARLRGQLWVQAKDWLAAAPMFPDGMSGRERLAA